MRPRAAHDANVARGPAKWPTKREARALLSDPKEPLARFAERLSLPLIAAPMFLVSGVDLVVAASGHGVIGWFPTANCRNADELHRSNVRLRDDLRIVLKHAPGTW